MHSKTDKQAQPTNDADLARLTSDRSYGTSDTTPQRDPFTKVKIIDSGTIRRLVLTDPSTRNSLSVNTLTELEAALNSPIPNTIRSLIISSVGKVFSSGHNFMDLDNITKESAIKLFALSQATMQRIRALPLPVIAQVQGPAVGAGSQLALTADFIVASEEASFQTPGGSKGWFCFTPMVPLSRSTAPKRALEMLFSGAAVTASQALDWGMVNRVVATKNIAKETEVFATAVSQGSREMLARGKQLFYEQLSLSIEDAYRVASTEMAASAQTDDAQRRIQAFTHRKK